MSMRTTLTALAAAAMILPATVATPTSAKPESEDKSSAKKAQDKGTAEIPTCTRRLGTIAITEPENKWWTELGLSNPEAIIKFFVMKSGCFGLVDRDRKSVV